MYNFKPIPIRTDDPYHLNNLLTPDQIKEYTDQCFEHINNLRFNPDEELAAVFNSLGYWVLLCNGVATELYTPTFKNNQVGFIIQNLFQNDHPCYKANCKNSYFGTVIVNREYKMCRKHYQQFERTGNIRNTVNLTFLSSDYRFSSDINGNFAYVACRNHRHKTAFYIKVDLEDLSFVLKNRPRKLDRAIIVDFKKNDGKRHTGRLQRVIYSKNRHFLHRYDNSLLSNYLVVDHLNRDFMDQRRFNLKLITPMKNLENSAKFDRLKAKGLFFGFGVKRLKNGEFEVKAYKLKNDGSCEIEQKKVFKELSIGLQWKAELEGLDLLKLGLTDQINEPTEYFIPKPIIMRKPSGGAA